MLSPRLTNCPECANIPSLLKKIDCKLAELGNNLYNNISYMLNKPIPAGDILQLIAYRRILMHKYCNPNYVHEYSVAMIASRVIRLTLGCVSRCNELERCLEEPCDIKIVPNPTTTSTSTLAPITTTTTTQSSISWNAGFANTGPSAGWLWNACNNPDEIITIYTANNVISPFPPNTPIYTDPGLTTLLYPSSTVAISILGFAYTVINGYTNPLGGSGQDCQFITTTSTTTLPPTTTTTTTICQDCIAHDVTIGTQVWTGCNLDVTTYRNGDPIPEVTDQGAWNSLTTGAWCYYENTSSNGTTYGKLYNWHAVNDPRGLAPIGYHIPSDAEWTTLVNYLGGDNVAGGHLKEPGFCHWEDPNTDADNSSGFTGLPSGNRGLSLLNPFVGITLFTYFWTSTPYLGGADGYAYQLRYVDGTVVRGFFTVTNGFAVRLIKDTEPTTTTTTSSSSTTTTTTTLAPINPDDIAGLWAWYKGDAGVIGGAQVTTWEDQSILGNDLLTELTAYPEAVTDTVGTLSTTVVRKVNFATLANMATAANFPNTNSTGSSMFVVCKVITSPGILQYVVKAPNMELYTNTTPAMNSVIGGGATLTQTVSYNTYYTFGSGTDLTNEYFSINNAALLTSPDVSGFYLPRKFRIFAQNGPGTFPSEQGDVAFAEIIVYNTTLTPTEILGVETYLRNKYNHY
jgi:uncharacterized protein (TIGR02145 family)